MTGKKHKESRRMPVVVPREITGAEGMTP